MKELKLPEELESLRDQLEQSRIERVQMTATSCKNSDLGITQSKFGGYPYTPAGFEYPRDENNQAMVLLAQINFTDVPPTESFPEVGILRFYVADDDMIGATDYWQNEEELLAQKNYRVVYHQTIATHVPLEGIPIISSSEYVKDHIYAPYSISFEKKDDFLGIAGFDFEHLFGDCIYAVIDIEANREDEIIEEYNHYTDTEYIDYKLGGYANVIQEDIRGELKHHQHYVQLLQMHTEPGALHFYIAPDDLKKRDFSKVIYGWSCA